MKKIFEKIKEIPIVKEVLSFGVVGVMNTLLGFVLMMVFYNVLHWSYWVTSATSYTIGSVFSFFMNRHFTFNHGKEPEKADKKASNKADKKLQEADDNALINKKHNSVWKEGLRFAISTIVCYLLAYSIAKPLVKMLLRDIFPINILENLAMMAGMVLYTTFNFFGQKFFVFRKKNNRKQSKSKSDQ